jgi:signal transduction histidine kinase
MKNSIHQKILFSFFFILSVIGLTGFAVYQSNQRMQDSVKWINHTEQVINISEKILSLTIDIETGSRGYALTQDSSFLDPIFKAEKTIFGNLTTLRYLTADNIHQKSRIDSLDVLIPKRIAFSLKTIEQRNSNGLLMVIQSVETKEGKNYSDQIRSTISNIQIEENNLLQVRKQQNETQVQVFNWFSTVMFLVMIISAILLLISIYKNLKQSHEKKIKADELIIINNELKISENKYQKLNEELEQLVVERTAKLEAANKELESFSYSVSHDLRAPIRAINGYTKILEEDYAEKLDQDGCLILESIVNNSKKMGSLIDDLLAFSKLGRKTITGSKIDMQEMVTVICEEITKENPDKQIDFKIHPLPTIYADPSLIKQVWLNLIGNSVKYSKYKPKSIIEIDAYQKEGKTVYSIKDNGAGFDMKYYNKLFGVFQRLHGQDEFEGTGIGLAIVQKVVTKHNGTVWGESIVDEGATFYFSLPNSKIESIEITN